MKKCMKGHMPYSAPMKLQLDEMADVTEDDDVTVDGTSRIMDDKFHARRLRPHHNYWTVRSNNIVRT